MDAFTFSSLMPASAVSSLITAFEASFQLALVFAASLAAMLSLLPSSLLSHFILRAEPSLSLAFRAFFRHHSNSRFVFAYLKFLAVFSDGSVFIKLFGHQKRHRRSGHQRRKSESGHCKKAKLKMCWCERFCLFNFKFSKMYFIRNIFLQKSEINIHIT